MFFTGDVRDMMMLHQFDEYQMHENMFEANDKFVMNFGGRSNDSGLNSLTSQLSTVNEEPDNVQTNPSGPGIPQITISRHSVSSQLMQTGQKTKKVVVRLWD